MNRKAPLTLAGALALSLGVASFAFAQVYPNSPPSSTADAPTYSTSSSPMTSPTMMTSPSMMTAGKAGGMQHRQSNSVNLSKSQVRKIQNALKDKGYYLEVDGIWGQNTIDDIKDLQFKNDLDVTGRPNTETMEALGLEGNEFGTASDEQYSSDSSDSRWSDDSTSSGNSGGYSSTVTETNRTGNMHNMREDMNTSAQLSQKQIKLVQKQLVQKGYQVQVTGEWGQETRSALIRFQKQNGLEATGFPNKQTRQALGISSRTWQPWSGSDTMSPSMGTS
ncbi:MAG: peptidoglycan-binding protein [Gammaproteobacteria bacterium]|nr:peptidoglycan-binding protein [Gammaproteobacteria bacterium]